MFITKKPENINNNIYISIKQPDGVCANIDIFSHEVIIGSSETCDITLNNKKVLDKHLKITITDSDFHLENLSEEPILINSITIKKKHKLIPDEIIHLGGYEISLKEVPKPKELPEEEDDSGKTKFMQVISVPEKSGRGRLVGISGSITGTIFEINKDKISVGRDPSNDISITKDGLSRAHAMLEIGDKCITVIDFNSTNGTFVKGKKITSEVIKPGTIIQFGNAALKYELDSEEALGGEEEKKSTSKIIPVLLILCILVSGVTYYFVSAKQKKAMAKEKQELERLAEQVKQAAEESPAKLLELAGKAMQENAFNEALKIIETVLAKNPNNAEAMLLKNKVTLKLKVSGLDESFNKGMKYYQSNDFDNARKAFSKIDTEYAKYDEVQKIIATLGKTDSAEQLTNDAFSLFTKGDLEQAINKLENALNLVPVLIQAKELRQTVLSVKELMTVLETASSNQQEQVLNKIVAAVPDSSNYFNTFAKDKLKELKTGKNLKTEIFYASGIEALATRQYAIAYENFKKAYALSPEIIKIKLALTETTQKRQKLLQKLNAAATAIEKESPIKAKYIWKKIIEFGEDDNSFYKSALDKLQI